MVMISNQNTNGDNQLSSVMLHCTMAQAMEIKANKIFKSAKLLHAHFLTKADDFFCKWCRTYRIFIRNNFQVDNTAKMCIFFNKHGGLVG